MLCFLPKVEVFSKEKVVPYTFVRRGVPVREDTYSEPSAFLLLLLFTLF